MEGSRKLLEGRIAATATFATLVGAIGTGLGIGAIAIGIYVAVGSGDNLFGPYVSPIVPGGLITIVGLIMIPVSVARAFAMLTQAATLQTFLDIEANTAAMLEELKRRSLPLS